MSSAVIDSKAGGESGAEVRAQDAHKQNLEAAHAKVKAKRPVPRKADGTHGKPGESSHKSRHKRRRKHKKKHKHHASGLPGAPAPPTIPVKTPPPSSTPPAAVAATMTLAQAQRFLWRAGFGPAKGQAESLVGQPIQQVVYSFTRPSGPATLSGAEPVNSEGDALEPFNEYGADHCWWLDRMVRSDQQLVEKMTLIWHDWFANSNEKVGSSKKMIEQNELFRSHALGNFHELFLAVTENPAMLIFLDSIYNDRYEINENYGREMLELFSLGADRGAYTEEDVKENARALTGWTAEWTESEGLQKFHFDESRHDTGIKTIFGHSGNWNYEDSVRFAVTHPMHPSFFVAKLWSYFVPVPPDEATYASLQGIYVSSGFEIRPVVEAILQHPTFLNGPELVTPPVVYNAGLLRAIGRPIDTTSWTWMCASAGQQLFYPPNVSGWDYTHWIDTSTAKARWEIASEVTSKTYCNPYPPKDQEPYSEKEEPSEALTNAFGYWGNPVLSSESQQAIARFAQSSLEGLITAKWQNSPYKAIRQNALRMLIATSPDMQVS